MTAIMMASMGAAAVTVAALETTITVGAGQYDMLGTDTDLYAYGYSVLNDDYLGLGNFGSMGSDTYTDGAATSRTIKAVYWTEDAGGAVSGDDNLYFSIDTTSVPDTDATFAEIEYNGNIYTRASRDAYAPSLNGSSHWIWLNVNPNPPTSGVRDFIIRL